jgi:hypothetical protein
MGSTDDIQFPGTEWAKRLGLVLNVKSTDTDLKRVAQSLRSANLDEAHRQAIDTVVLNGAASGLVQEALSTARCAVNDDVPAVQQLMGTLEALAEASPISARVLMATLWPAASRLHLHDVCDAIDLWIVNGMVDELRRQLLRMVESERNDASRRHVQQLLRST